MLLELLLLALVVLTLTVVWMRDLILAVIVLACADAALAVLFYLMAAPDVAITQITIFTGVMTFLFMLTIRKTERFEK
jgi:uncharacterized MnhB-related membrane protein